MRGCKNWLSVISTVTNLVGVYIFLLLAITRLLIDRYTSCTCYTSLSLICRAYRLQITIVRALCPTPVPEQMQPPRMRTRGRTTTQSLGADGDFNVNKWSKKHMANVVKGLVDKCASPPQHPPI